MNKDTVTHKFYMWQHPYTQKTCYGITGDEQKRKRSYQGSNGFDIEWSFLVVGRIDEIKKLEKTLKSKLKQVELSMGQKITYGEYEWIESNVEYSTIEDLMLELITSDNYTTLCVKRRGNQNLPEFD
jgi:hypothetical protein